MDTLGEVFQELDFNLCFKNLKLDMGGMNLVIHAIVVVTMGLVTSRIVVVIYLLLLSLSNLIFEH